MHKFDLIIIGSGLSGLHAAYPAVKEGLEVLMLDVGYDEHAMLEQDKPLSFEGHRRTDPLQYQIFLGEDLSGMGDPTKGNGHAASMTRGRREYISRNASALAPLVARNAEILQSFATGGLSEAWGAVCGFFDEDEFHSAGLPLQATQGNYEKIIEKIGASGPKSDLYSLQPPARLDTVSAKLLERYGMRKAKLDGLDFEMRQPVLALLTQDKEGRLGTSYRNMDFWDNVGRSVYRGHYSLEELLTEKNFSYRSLIKVDKVLQEDGLALARGKDINTGKELEFRAKALVLAAGAVNSTRIALRSRNMFDVPVPIIL